jgi:hypothetical protein
VTETPPSSFQSSPRGYVCFWGCDCDSPQGEFSAEVMLLQGQPGIISNLSKDVDTS